MFAQIPRVLKSFTKNERYIFIGSLIIFFVSLFFWGLLSFYNLTVESPARGGRYREGIVGQPTTLNPLIVGSNDVDRDLTELLFADLTELAESIKLSDDDKSWTITLKPDLRWSDDKPLTTADVLFTLETIQNPDSQSPAFATWQGVVGERLSEKEIRLSLKNSYAFFRDNLARLKIVPRHIFGNIPPSNLRLSNYNLEPVGSGAYKFAGYEKQKDGFIKRYELEINKNYAGNQPYLENFELIFFNNENEALSAFNRKEIDGLGGLHPQKTSALKLGHKIYTINVPRYYAIFLNQSTHPALKEKAVRQALSDVIDRNAMIAKLFESQALAIDGPIPPIIEGYAPDNFGIATNTAAIAEALEKAGWKINDEGVREKTISRNKVRLEFSISVPQVDFLITAAEEIKNYWQEIGVNLNPTVLTIAEANEAIKTRNYSLLIFGNTLRGNADAFSFWHSSERFHPGLNLSIYNSKTADNLLEAIRQDFNSETRNQKLAKLQSTIRQDLPAIFLFSPSYIYAAPRGLKGLDINTLVTSSDRFAAVAEWHLKTSRKLR